MISTVVLEVGSITSMAVGGNRALPTRAALLFAAGCGGVASSARLFWISGDDGS